ncbi:MAG TPA: PIN domain-containing protein [Anaeromyxobacter sp.]|nr:PIN domain-containing protein [Anaeromyxobacter sp.]
MGRTVLVDTSYLVAVLDGCDRLHARALALARELAGADARLVTTDLILVELANYFARSPLRRHAIDWISAIRGGGWEVVPLDARRLARAEERYRRHSDKTWSLTDCHAMEVGSERRIREIATTDAGYEQAGFERLMVP